MLGKICISLLFSCSILTTNNCFGGHLASLSIHGEVLPTSCSLNLSNPNVNIGALSIQTLPATKDGSHQLKDMAKDANVNFSIICDALVPTALTFQATAKPVSMLNIYDDHNQVIRDEHYQSSLGATEDGKTLAAYLISFRNAESVNIDGKNAAHIIFSSNNGRNWKEPADYVIPQDNSTLVSWSLDGTNFPQPAEKVTGSLHLLIAINAIVSSVLDERVLLEGSTTVTLNYI